MESLKIFSPYYREGIYWTFQFLAFVTEQKKNLKELEFLYKTTNLRIQRGNVKNFYAILLKVEHAKRKFIKKFMKESFSLISKFDNADLAEKERIYNFLKEKETNFNLYYPKIKLTVFCNKE